jgi:hypothetical protein
MHLSLRAYDMHVWCPYSYDPKMNNDFDRKGIRK